MNGKRKKGSEYFRLLDLFIVMLFSLIAIFCIDMFRYDFLRTVNLRNVEPIGTVVIKKNTVQRRISDRVLWDRLAGESPVYIGDLIRVAEVSAATLYVDDNSIDLDENTLIRITRAADGKSLRLELSEGTISLASGAKAAGVSLALNGKQVLTAPNTVLSAGINETGGIIVQVNEGSAQIIEAGSTVREIPSGTLIVMDANGTEQKTRAVVVTQPAPNARYLKPAEEPLTVHFSWNRINLAPVEKLRMEIARDRKFTRISGVIENLDTQAQVQLDAGAWYWRLLFDNTVLSTGRLTAVDASVPGLKSPAFNSLFHYRDKPPVLNFQWSETEEAVSYIIEVSSTVDFSTPRIRSLSSAASIKESGLEEGTWYWRVMPVFPMLFSGSAVFSTASFFRIEQISAVPPAASETAGTTEESSLSQWLAAQAPSKELPPDLPPDIIPPHLRKPPEPLAAQLPSRSQPPKTLPLQTPQIPPLASPRGLQPANGSVFGIEEFRIQRTIPFSWTAVQGANGYIFTLYQQTTSGRRQIVRQTINSGTGYTLTNLSLLDRGNFIWQVEGVSTGRGGAIERRGEAGESTFIIDFPSSAPLHIENAGIMNGD